MNSVHVKQGTLCIYYNYFAYKAYTFAPKRSLLFSCPERHFWIVSEIFGDVVDP